MKQRLDLERIVEPVIQELGYNFVDLECISAKGGAILRIYIDKEQGVNLEDCKKVSYQVKQVLSVEDSKNDYTLEISSPGIDRKK